MTDELERGKNKLYLLYQVSIESLGWTDKIIYINYAVTR